MSHKIKILEREIFLTLIFVLNYNTCYYMAYKHKNFFYHGNGETIPVFAYFNHPHCLKATLFDIFCTQNFFFIL